MYQPIKEQEIESYDLIIVFFCSNYYYALPKASCPIIYFSDATFPAMVDYYPDFSHLYKFNIRQGISIETECLRRVTKGIFSSDWARESAIKDLNAPSEKVHTIEFGANIDENDNKQINILFLGVEWKRKGGDIAIETTEWLNKNGVNAVIHIVGIRQLSKTIAELPYVVNHGFLDKNDSIQYNELINTIMQCHCMLLPTFNECAGIAFSEASAYGLPSFSHRTGGVSNYVLDGINGYLLPLGSSGEDFGRKMKECIISNELYKMRKTARKLYEEKLNWNAWGKKVERIINDVMETKLTSYKKDE